MGNILSNRATESLGRMVYYCRSKVTAPKNIIWVASYPRSGNIWTLQIIQGLFGPRIGVIPDVHHKPPSAFYRARKTCPGDEGICFIKTHTSGFPRSAYLRYLSGKAENFGFVYLYRHPLDIFVSSLNFLALEERREDFLDGKTHSIEDLKESGEIHRYTRLFIDSLTIGSGAFEKMCGGTWLEHVDRWINLHASGEFRFSFVLRYEDMHEDTFSALRPLAHALGKDDLSLISAIGSAAEATKRDGKYFWKRRAGSCRNYLTQNEIDEFHEKYALDLERLGYGNQSGRV